MGLQFTRRKTRKQENKGTIDWDGTNGWIYYYMMEIGIEGDDI